jgi:hypothetical protein
MIQTEKSGVSGAQPDAGSTEELKKETGKSS